MRVDRRAALSVSASPCRRIGGGCKADEWIASFSLRSWDTLMAMTLCLRRRNRHHEARVGAAWVSSVLCCGE